MKKEMHLRFLMGASMALVATLGCTAVVFGASPVEVSPATMPRVGTVSDRFQSFNIEMLEVTGGRFWAPYKKAGATPEAPKPTEKSVIPGMDPSVYSYRPPVDFSDSRLRKLSEGLAPSYMRVSGTWANSTYFDDSDGPAPTKTPAGFNGVLTRKQWKGVVDFSNATDAKLVTSFAVSAGVRDANGVWTPVEAKKFLAYTKEAGGSIAAAAMFNEPTFAMLGGAPKGYDAAAYGRDFKVFRAYVKEAAPAMLILGPGGIGEKGLISGPMSKSILRTEDLLKAEGPGLDGFSYHFYGAVSERCAKMMGPGMGTTPEAALTRDWLMRTDRDEAFYAGLRDKYSPGTPMWLTETGEAACGGDPWAKDFIDSFRYLNQLGTLAKHGVQVVMQNTLNASDYGLVDETTLVPRPNYWAAIMWRKMMGTTVLDAGDSAGPNLYLYAHCLRGQPGGVALLAINADRTEEAQLTVPEKSERYTLSGELMSEKVNLNGKELNVSADWTLPKIQGRKQKAGSVKLAPASITFLAIKDAGNGVCRQ